MLPVAAHVLPVRIDLIPPVGNPVSTAVFEYVAPRNPGIGMTVPLPITRSPGVAVARRRNSLDPRRGWRDIRLDGPGGSRSQNTDSAGAKAQRHQQSFANSPHFPDSFVCSPLTTPIGVSRTYGVPQVKRKL